MSAPDHVPEYTSTAAAATIAALGATEFLLHAPANMVSVAAINRKSAARTALMIADFQNVSFSFSSDVGHQESTRVCAA
jgi:hypothetical protein